ncbi:MAG: MutS-related protein [Rhodanobacteraceae bacterium]
MAVVSIPAKESFSSILWRDAQAAGTTRDDVAIPDCFGDLNLDRVEQALTAMRPEENLAPFFRAPLRNHDAIAWRQEILRDLGQAPRRHAFTSFVKRMRAMREKIARIDKLFYKPEKELALLGAVDAYRAATQTLTRELGDMQPVSRGLGGLFGWLEAYTASAGFKKLAADARELLSAFEAIRYSLIIRGGSVTVQGYEEEADASVDIEATFAKFRRDAGNDYRVHAHGRIGINGLNHIEAQVLDKVAILNPGVFATLEAFCAEHANFVDATLARLAREVCFYLAWLEYTDSMRHAGLQLCFPAVDPESKAIMCDGGFDIALAAEAVKTQQPVVGNDVALSDPERILMVSGPNNGGKTTFARMFGQLHWLAALGFTVPGTQARLFLFDRMLTHFEREESIETLRGKLKDDLYRIHRILAEATPRSIIIVNEIFASTTLDDALRLGRRIMERLVALDALAVCVTFLTELAEFDAKTVSMVAEVDQQDPAIRTYKVTRRPADGLAYALAIANKYRVTHEWLLRRIAP